MQRMVWAVLAAFVAAILAGPWLIRELRKLKVGQNVYELAPEEHKKKQGTPNMALEEIVQALAAAISAL